MWVLALMVLLFLGLALAAAKAWWSLRNGRASGRYWVLTASILNLPLLGLGTIVGISGFVIFKRYDRAIQIAAKRAAAPAALPGHGTSKYGAGGTQTGQIGVN